MKAFVKLLILCVILCGCASTSVEDDSQEPRLQPARLKVLPPYTGPKTVVAILPLGLSERAAKRYPHLLEKSVGMGVHHLVLDTLFDTNRFKFVEENPEMVKDIMNRQWMSASGFVSQKEAVEYGKMLGAEKIIYGEVYDYSEGGEQISGFQSKKNFIISVGIQIVCTDIGTGEKVALGTANAQAASYSQASKRAISDAVYKMISRLERK